MSSTRRTKKDKEGQVDNFPTPYALCLKAWELFIADGWFLDLSTTKFLEPSCGSCNWIRASLQKGIPAENWIAVDVRPEACEAAAALGVSQVICADFESVTREALAFIPDAVVGNPPFVKADEHIAHARHLLGNGLLFQLLLAKWSTANKRKGLQWGGQRPLHKYEISPSPCFLSKGSGSDSAPYHVHVWGPGNLRSLPLISPLHWDETRDVLKAAAREEERARKAAAREEERARKAAAREEERVRKAAERSHKSRSPQSPSEDPRQMSIFDVMEKS